MPAVAVSALASGTTLEIDGFPLVFLRTVHGPDLRGDPARRLWDGQPSGLLDTAMSLVTTMGPNNAPNWAKILAGEGVTYGVAGCVPAAKYAIDDSRPIRWFTWKHGAPPNGPMWYVFFEGLGQTFIPRATLVTILQLAIDVASGKDVALPEHARVDPPPTSA